MECFILLIAAAAVAVLVGVKQTARKEKHFDACGKHVFMLAYVVCIFGRKALKYFLFFRFCIDMSRNGEENSKEKVQQQQQQTTKSHKNRFIIHALQVIMRITSINIFISVWDNRTQRERQRQRKKQTHQKWF